MILFTIMRIEYYLPMFLFLEILERVVKDMEGCWSLEVERTSVGIQVTMEAQSNSS
jgi:hypothetical protein